ncbi:MAG: tetratricopeptide repeat protein [Chloroflexi bacterium]|nr:tetratricopeptide repeat protein [Chloroflexota bacterium]
MVGWEAFVQWINAHKDALTFLFGSGLLLTVLAALRKGVRWLLRWRRERQLRSDDNPFIVLPPGSDILSEVLPDTTDSPLSDRRIPYKERVPGRNICEEMEKKLKEKRALLVCGRSGLGKTREAAHLAQILNNEGWTVLYLPPDAWLEPPARLPKGVPGRRLLFFLDDLSRRCYSSRQEINPRAESPAHPLTLPFQVRLRKTLEAYETFCGKGEILVLATTRDEREPEYEGEPAEWDKLEWARYPELWNRFECYHLPEPDPQVAAELLAEVGQAAGVQVEQPEVLARHNDGTLRNLVENLRTAANPFRGRPVLSLRTFRDTLRGTWEDRYRRAVERHPEARYLYQAALLLRRYGFPLRRYTLLPLARSLMGPGRWWAKYWWAKYMCLPRALRYLERYEGIYTPRDGQLEVAGPVKIDERKIIEQLICLGQRYRLADALHHLATRLMWPEGAADAVHHPAAVRILCQVVTWQPENAAAWYRLGGALYKAKKYDQAIQAFQKAIDLDPNDAYPWNGLGLVYEARDKYAEAIRYYQKTLEIDPKYKWTWNNLGNVYSDLGRYEDAIEAYQKAIALDPKDAVPWNNLGIVYRRLGRYEDAIEAYQKAIALDPKDAAPWNNLGNVYSDLGRYEDAIEAYQKAIALDPKDAAPWNNLGNVYSDLGRYEDAIEVYQKAIALDPKYAAPWNGLGIVYRRLGRYEDAIEAYQKAIALDPKFKWAWNNLGNVYRDLGRYEDAIEAYQKAIALDSKDAAPWNGLGTVYSALGRYKEALNAYRKAVELAPDDGVYRLGLMGALLRLGREEEALREEQFVRSLMTKENEYNRVCFAALTGDKNEALRLLKITLEKIPGLRDWARRDPDLESLHDDPRFWELVNGQLGEGKRSVS